MPVTSPAPGEVREARTFPHEVESARAARRWAEPILHTWGLDGLTEVALIVVSELVANGVLHGRGPVLVELRRSSDALRIEVTDDGTSPVGVVRGPVDRPSGRGLAIVEQLADHWGVDAAPAGKAVWAELEDRS